VSPDPSEGRPEVVPLPWRIEPERNGWRVGSTHRNRHPAHRLGLHRL